MYTDEIQKKRADAKAQQQQDAYQKSVADLAANVTELLNSLEKTGAKKLDTDFIQAVKQLSSIASSLADVKVSGDMEMKRILALLTGAIKNIDAAPIVQVAPTPVKVTETKVDLSPVTDAIKALSKQAKPKDTQVDFSAVTDAVKEVTQAVNGLSFPVPNYVLPFKGTNGDATQVQLDASGNVPVSGTLSIDTTGLATSAKQDTGNTSLSSIDGKITTVNTGAVVVSSSTLPSGAATAAKQPALGTAGTASSDVLTVQGIASMTALKVDGSAVTQPVSGTFWQATQPVSLASVPSHNVTNAGTFAVQAAQSGTWNVGTVTSISNNVNTVEVAPTTILNGKKTVTTAGTRVILASSTACKSVTIKALSSNTGTIYVGDSTVASTNGLELLAGDAVSLDIANLNTVNIDASVSGEGVTYLGVN
jgi:hypothetical protein